MVAVFGWSVMINNWLRSVPGGVLRDIAHTYGAVRLTELHRFADPAEAAATLALREGRPEALGFYLDRRRVHVGDPTTTLDNVFNAWQNDRNQGLDAIMLAPTRELVSRLNQRAQDHRLAGATPDRQVDLADGNTASVGDLVITRRNDRRVRISATDWVKNGDRWTVLNLTRTRRSDTPKASQPGGGRKYSSQPARRPSDTLRAADPTTHR